MTVLTDDRPVAAGGPMAPAEPAAPPAVSSRPARSSLASEVLASAGLALYSLAVAAGFARVFAGWAFLDNLIVLVIVGHGVGLATRRIGLPGWLSIPTVVVALCWVLGFMFYADTYAWGLPTSETWTLFSAELDLVREQFRVAVAPVLDGGGWDVLAAIGLALAVVLADSFAFGALARAEALVPGGVLFVFVAALGADRLRVPLSVTLVGAGVVATVLLRAHHAPGGISGHRGRSAARVVMQAAVVSSVVALGAGYVGQRLPGAAEEPLFETRGGGNGDGTVLNPLVDIRSRLTLQTDTELFVVQASAQSYWRSAALPEFDGTTWSLPDRALGTPRAGSMPAVNTQEIRQLVRIGQLGGSLIPAAPDPIAATGPNDLRFESATSTLVSADDSISSGEAYEIVSAAPRPDPSVLAGAASVDPGDPIFLELPDDFPDIARELANEVAAGASTPYEVALSLQNWFQSEFTYSLEVQPGHGNNAIEGFLRERVGYCEQFAGTYAAMMRSLGFPSRVSVGFTAGRAIGGDTYSVAGRNAHAWPEVWFDGVGWVLFEPTPGRGAPGAESYTGLAPQQDDETGSAPSDTTAPDEDPAPTTTNPRTPDERLDPGAIDVPEGGGPTIEPPPESGSGIRWLQLAIVAALGAGLALPAVVRRVRRRAPGRTPTEQIGILWARALGSLRDAGVPITDSNTPAENAQLTIDVFPIAARPIRSLAEVVTMASYRPEGASGFDTPGAYGSSVLRDSAHWTRQIERAVTDSITRGERIRRYFTTWR